MKKHWGDAVKGLTVEELDAEGATMLVHRKVCTKMAIDDLSLYTNTMASILDVKINVLGCETPVYDRNNWIQSLMGEPSDLQIQKWIFAWLFVRSNYNHIGFNLKSPEELFENNFLRVQNLQYDNTALSSMKKNSKTCVRLLYNLRARSWKELMLTQIKEKLGTVLSLTAPKEERNNERNYRREPNTFFIGKIIAGKTTWNKVKCVLYIVNLLCLLLVTLNRLKITRFVTKIAVIGKIGLKKPHIIYGTNHQFPM